MTNKLKRVFIGILIAMAFFVGACTCEGGVPGREVCIGEGC